MTKWNICKKERLLETQDQPKLPHRNRKPARSKSDAETESAIKTLPTPQPQGRMASWLQPIKLCRTHAKFPIIANHCKRRNPFKLIPRGQCDLTAKTRTGQQKELPTNILDERRCKNP